MNLKRLIDQPHTRTRLILAVIIVGTLPLYCVGFSIISANVRQRDSHKMTPTVTPTLGFGQSLTATAPTLVYFSSPTITQTGTITLTPTVTVTYAIPATRTPTPTTTETLTPVPSSTLTDTPVPPTP